MKKLISLLLCLALLAGLGALPALAAEPVLVEEPVLIEEPDGDAPAEDGWGLPANVFYYLVIPDSVKSPECFAMEYVEPGGHPGSVPVWRTTTLIEGHTSENAIPFTWYLSPELSGEPVDPASFTVEAMGDELHFYGFLDTVRIRLHMPAGTVINGNEIDVFKELNIQRGSVLPAWEFDKLPTGYWAAAWADAEGNIIDTDNTPFLEDTDLWAVEGDFRATYIFGAEDPLVERPWEVAVSGGSSVLFSGEGFLEPGTPRHLPTGFQRTRIQSYPMIRIITEWIDIVGWLDENGAPVDPASLTISEDRTFYAMTVSEDTPVVAIAEDGKTAQVSGSFDGLFARVALVIDNGGVSGLYVTQAVINPDGLIVIPAFLIPGLTVKGVNVALVPSLTDILSPKPDVSASAFRMFG